jgi:hypothetical protein
MLQNPFPDMILTLGFVIALNFAEILATVCFQAPMK